MKNGVGTTVAATRWRTASTVTSISQRRARREVRAIDGRERDHLLQHRRPRRRRRPADLAAAAIDRHRDARRGRADRRRQPERLVDALDVGPVDLEPDDLPRAARAACSARERLLADEAALRRASTSRPRPISYGVYFCDSISAFLLLKKSTSMSSRPASTRATSSASMPGRLDVERPRRRPSARPRRARASAAGIQIS